MELHESSENYLETILMLGATGNPIRSIDIVNELNYTKPSVSVAMKKLRSHGYIHIDDNGYITLTDAGREIAESMYERHVLFSDWLILLGVDPPIAAQDACKVEHVISEQTFTAIRTHIETWKRTIEANPDDQ